MSIDERVYFETPKVKVTNIRVVFGHDTVLIDKIGSVDTNLRVVTLYASFLLVVLSLGIFFVSPYWAILFIGLSFIWARWEYEHYIELIVNSDGKCFKIASSSLSSRDVVYKIADALGLAIADNKRRKDVPGLTETETMQLRRLLIQMDKVDVSGLEVNPRKGAAGRSAEPAPKRSDTDDVDLPGAGS